MSDRVTTITGHSDDLIEADGEIYEEWTAGEGVNYLAFSTGDVISIRYGDTGIWRISPVVRTSALTIEQCAYADGDDGPDYTDRAHIVGATWVVLGEAFAKAVAS